MRRLGPWLACLGLCACAAAPKAPERTEPAHGAIVMVVQFRGREFPYWRRHAADDLFFARVSPTGRLEAVLVPANHSADDRIYALNIPPGKYALVAASYQTGRTRQLARLSENLASAWTVDVKPGALVFGGVAELRRPFEGWGAFFLNGARRAASYLPPFKRAVVVINPTLPRLDKSPELELQALRLARQDLAGTYWADVVDARLRELGAPPPQILEGLVRRRPAKRHDAGRFSYIETLDWGTPRAVDGGLEWSEPRGNAWISVTFAASDSPGFKPLSAALADLRDAGSAEDTHTVAEIMVSSRAAYSARYTTYLYPEAALLGSETRVLKTETVIVPAARGFYKLQYRAQAAEFLRRRQEFARFVEYLVLNEVVERRR